MEYESFTSYAKCDMYYVISELNLMSFIDLYPIIQMENSTSCNKLPCIENQSLDDSLDLTDLHIKLNLNDISNVLAYSLMSIGKYN